MRQLSHHVSVLSLLTLAAIAAQTDVTGATFGIAGFDSLTVKARLGAIGAGGVVTLKLQGGHAADGSDAADIEGAVAVATDTDDQQFLLLEIHRPVDYEYITAIVERSVADSEIVTIEALLYGASDTPVAQPGVADVVSLVSPPLAA